MVVGCHNGLIRGGIIAVGPRFLVVGEHEIGLVVYDVEVEIGPLHILQQTGIQGEGMVELGLGLSIAGRGVDVKQGLALFRMREDESLVGLITVETGTHHQGEIGIIHHFLTTDTIDTGDIAVVHVILVGGAQHMEVDHHLKRLVIPVEELLGDETEGLDLVDLFAFGHFDRERSSQLIAAVIDLHVSAVIVAVLIDLEIHGIVPVLIVRAYQESVSLRLHGLDRGFLQGLGRSQFGSGGQPCNFGLGIGAQHGHRYSLVFQGLQLALEMISSKSRLGCHQKGEAQQV